MSPTRAQNRVRREYGIGKGKLLAEMRELRDKLYRFATDATWLKAPDEMATERAHKRVDDLAAFSRIAAAYREAESKSL